jgi:hypothetical protein
MLRKILFSIFISGLLLSSFAFVSQEYRATVTQSGLESPIVASLALATEASTDLSPLSVTVLATASTILFHQPFDQARVMLKVEPAVQVAVSWVEDSFASLPTNPLAAGSLYTFTHVPTALSRHDAPLAVPYPRRLMLRP